MKLTENTKVRVRVPKHLYEAIQAELAKKEEVEESIEEGQLEEWVGLNPDLYTATTLMGLGLPVLTAIIAAGPKAIGQMAYEKVKQAIQAIKAKKGGKEAPKAEEPTEEVEETLDLESLMEAVKDAAKKKAEDKKKKEAADKKKKEAEDKKKKEAEAKKKADAKKK
jgi:Skp family chaperone for outer membrane proteins